MQIAHHTIGPAYRPFIIAEMSGNHNQSLERALAIVDAAAQAGAHALKIQTYTADTMTLDLASGEFLINDANSLWAGKTLHQLYAEAHTPWAWHAPIFERARALGLIAFSTPFDETAVDFLETLKVPCYKIASFELTDLPLIRKVAATGKPMIVSTGMSTTAEIDETVRAARDAGCRDLILLKCTSTYPASPQNTHLRTIPNLRQWSGCEVGLSDHTMGIGAAIAAVALGASVIEKHFTLCRADGGVDSAFSLEPDELRALVVETENAWQALGQIHYGASRDETKSLIFRRSLYAALNISAGEPFTPHNVRAIRPGLGLPPKYLERLLGKTARRDIARGTPITWDEL
jgi:pseudaminic acid synthase